MRKGYPTAVLALLVLFMACTSDEEGETPQNPSDQDQSPVLSSENDILSFTIPIGEDQVEANIDGATINTILPDDIDLTRLAPTIEISDKATVNPASGVVQDFSEEVTYVVTAEDGSTNEYTASLSSSSSSTVINTFSFTNLAEGQASSTRINRVPEDIDTIYHYVPYLSPIEGLTSAISIAPNASIEPPSGETLDYTSPVGYTVTAQNGDTKEYLVIVDNRLQQLRIDGIVGDQFRDSDPGDEITFSVNQLNPVQDSIKVNLKATEEYDLLVTNVNYDTKEITVKLPDDYLNDLYSLQVSIEHDNADESDLFYLDRGEIHYKGVQDYRVDGIAFPYETLLMPAEQFYVDVILDRSEFDEYEFALRKSDVDHMLTIIRLDANIERVYLRMPELPDQRPIGGQDFRFIIKKGNQEFEFDFKSERGSPIEVIVAQSSVVTGTNTTEVQKGGELIITGENLFYPYVSALNTSVRTSSTAALVRNGRPFALVFASADSSTANFTVNENMPSGTYNLEYSNNVEGQTETIDTGIDITVLLDESDHPSLAVSEAVYFPETDEFFPRQIRIRFNESIENVDIQEIRIFGRLREFTIGNFLTTTNAILSNALSDNDFSEIRGGVVDGHVIISDNGQTYTLPFALKRSVQ